MICTSSLTIIYMHSFQNFLIKKHHHILKYFLACHAMCAHKRFYNLLVFTFRGNACNHNPSRGFNSPTIQNQVDAQSPDSYLMHELALLI